MGVKVLVTGARGGRVPVHLQASVINAVKNFAKQLGISKLQTAVTVRIHKAAFIDYWEGQCEAETKRRFIIDVCLYADWLRVLSHEMVHVKQFALGELSPGLDRWKSRKNVDDLEYDDQPWEKEARRMQYKLVEVYDSQA